MQGEDQQREFVWTRDVAGIFFGIGLMGTVLGALTAALMCLPFMADPSNDWGRRAFLALFIAGSFWVLGAGLSTLLPKRVTASVDGLKLERAILRPQVIPRAEIAGVRTRSGGRHQEGRVEIVLRERPIMVFSTVDLEPRGTDFRAALLDLYGPASVDLEWERVVCGDDAVTMSQRTAEFAFTPRSRWVMAIDVLSVCVLLGVGIWWKELHQWLVHSRDPNKLLVLGVLFGGTGAVVMLALSVLDLAKGGAHQTLRVGPDGIVIQRRWRREVIPRDRIEGATAFQHLHNGKMRRGLRIVLLNRRWAWMVWERGIVAEPGLVAGVLMHRFGEWVPRSRESDKDSTRCAGGVS